MLRRLNYLALATVMVWAGVAFAPRPVFGAQKEGKVPTAEEIAETVILVFGGRQRLSTIQRNGVERGRLSRTNGEGRTEDITYERRFVRGETVDKDKIRLDQKMPSMEFSLVFNGGRVFGIVNGTTFTPRQEAVDKFLLPSKHGIDALLRYKENGSTLTFVAKEKHKNIDTWVVDLVDKEKIRTRYYISAQRARVLWLEYEENTPTGETAKFKRTFHDYTYAQGTLVPYRTVLYADGKQAEQSNILTVSFGLKMDDTLFQNTEAATN